jgi:hypothetical protein
MSLFTLHVYVHTVTFRLQQTECLKGLTSFNVARTLDDVQRGYCDLFDKMQSLLLRKLKRYKFVEAAQLWDCMGAMAENERHVAAAHGPLPSLQGKLDALQTKHIDTLPVKLAKDVDVAMGQDGHDDMNTAKIDKLLHACQVMEEGDSFHLSMDVDFDQVVTYCCLHNRKSRRTETLRVHAHSRAYSRCTAPF